jgi:hypothetical protein
MSNVPINIFRNVIRRNGGRTSNPPALDGVNPDPVNPEGTTGGPALPDTNKVSYNLPDNKNATERAQARENIGAVEEAPINGNLNARKDGAWVSFNPFVVAGTPAEGNVVTWESGVPTWADPSGGGNFIAYDVSQSLTGAQIQQALDNIGSNQGSIETFTNSGSVTIDNLVISKSNIEFTGSSTVTLRGIVPLWVGQEVTFFNRTGNNLSIVTESEGSSPANRFQQGTDIAPLTLARYKYVNFNGQFRWVLASNLWVIPVGAQGITHSGFVGIGTNAETAVQLAIRTNSTVGLRIRDVSNNIIFESVGASFRFNSVTAFGNAIPEDGIALGIRPISFNIAMRVYSTSGVRQVDVMGNNGNWQSKGGAFFGAADTGNVPTSRVDIRGAGTGATRTLLLEDLNGNDNAIWWDNGNIDFFRLPTTDPLVFGRLWNDSGTLKISAG